MLGHLDTVADRTDGGTGAAGETTRSAAAPDPRVGLSVTHRRYVPYSHAQKMVAVGYQFVTLASDSRFLAAKAAEEVAAVRKTAGGGGRLPAY